MIETTRKSALLSKIKRIKRLKKFTGLFKQKTPQAPLWLKSLRNARKNIEEVPILGSIDFSLGVNQLFWRKLYHQNLKSFLNITRVGSQRIADDLIFDDHFMNPLIKNSFIKYLKGMSKLKELNISVDFKNFKEIKWLFGKLDKMNGLLYALEDIKLEFIENDSAMLKLLQYRNVLHSLTSLKFSGRSVKFDPDICIIPQVCPNLTSLSMGFERFFAEIPGFINFLEGVQRLPKLISLQFSWAKDLKLFWSYFKPQSSLRSLSLSFDASNILPEKLFGTDDRDYLLEITKSKDLATNLFADLIKNWDSDIKQLENIEFNITCHQLEDLSLASLLITGVLQKVQKLTCFRYEISKQVKYELDFMDWEPFSIRNVPHLYDSLKKLEIDIENFQLICRPQLSFDLKKLRVFKNLKAIRLVGKEFSKVNIEEAIQIIEENQKKGEYPELELKHIGIDSKGLRRILDKISTAKRVDKNLKIKLNWYFYNEDDEDAIEILEGFYQVMQGVKAIKGLKLELGLGHLGISPDDLEVKRILREYPEVKNIEVQMNYSSSAIFYFRVDGEKEQFFVYYY